MSDRVCEVCGTSMLNDNPCAECVRVAADRHNRMQRAAPALYKAFKAVGLIDDEKSLASQVAELEAEAVKYSDCKCREIRVMLMLNFGPAGRAVQGLIESDGNLTAMLIAVLQHYRAENKKLREASSPPTIAEDVI